MRFGATRPSPYTNKQSSEKVSVAGALTSIFRIFREQKVGSVVYLVYLTKILNPILFHK